MNTSKTVGYARINPNAQNVDREIALLTEAGCARVFVDRCSGLQPYRPEFAEALDYLTLGDVLFVAGWHRLSRSTKQSAELTAKLQSAASSCESCHEASRLSPCHDSISVTSGPPSAIERVEGGDHDGPQVRCSGPRSRNDE